MITTAQAQVLEQIRAGLLESANRSAATGYYQDSADLRKLATKADDILQGAAALGVIGSAPKEVTNAS